ncbi:MAG: hypothetical protein JST00_27865 [Deltaproteobacteria bacterium]|nr:hypothetical protein [Deltaproteobacteria bacterium]
MEDKTKKLVFANQLATKIEETEEAELGIEISPDLSERLPVVVAASRSSRDSGGRASVSSNRGGWSI